jgi:hypothetical protein
VPRHKRYSRLIRVSCTIVDTRHARALGCEGIVSKRLGSHYRSFRIDHWLKIKNPAALAVSHERRIGLKLALDIVGAI